MEVLSSALLKETVETEFNEVSLIPKFFNEIKDVKDNNIEENVNLADSNEKTNIYLITRNESLEGDIHPLTGVPFEKQIIELNSGEVIEGVFPIFEATFEAKIPDELFLETDYKQFKCCNEQLYESIEKNSSLKEMFNQDQLDQIKEGLSDGSAPDGYVWHHAAEPGVIQLVDSETHALTGHTGGRAVWGGGNENR